MLTTDVSRMYLVVRLPDYQRNLHHFAWREDPKQQLRSYRMTRLTSGVSAASFAANMALRRNAVDHLETHPQEACMALELFYVDDGLMGADTVSEAIHLRREIHQLFKMGCFKLRKWKANERDVLASIPEDLRENKTKQAIHH